jgi:predicted RNase H-like nuclease
LLLGWRLKAYEDKLDAVVCAAVAIACLNGEARAFRDEDAAIWVPTMRPTLASGAC